MDKRNIINIADNNYIFNAIEGKNKYMEKTLIHIEDKINIQELDKSKQTAKYSIFIEKPIIGEASSFNDYIKSNNIDKKMVDRKAHKIDGPFIKMEYNGNSLNYFYYKQSKLHPENWAKITNHIICNICEEFCNQGCFQRNFDN